MLLSGARVRAGPHTPCHRALQKERAAATLRDGLVTSMLKTWAIPIAPRQIGSPPRRRVKTLLCVTQPPPRVAAVGKRKGPPQGTALVLLGYPEVPRATRVAHREPCHRDRVGRSSYPDEVSCSLGVGGSSRAFVSSRSGRRWLADEARKCRRGVAFWQVVPAWLAGCDDDRTRQRHLHPITRPRPSGSTTAVATARHKTMIRIDRSGPPMPEA